MAGFLNALSALAPVAPALSDAHDLRTARTQQQADFASDQALKQAQLTVQNLAAQGEQQRLTRSNLPVTIGESYWNPLTHSEQIRTQDPNTGAITSKDVPGVDPRAAAEDSYQAARADYKKVTGHDPTPDEDESLFFQSYGYKPPAANKFTPLPGAAGQPQSEADGLYYIRGRDADGAIVAQSMGPDYKPPPPKASNPYLDWKAQNPNGTVEQYEAMLGRTRVNTAGGPGSWTMAEGGDGGTVLYNSKTGETRQAPGGLHKSGYYAKNIAPLEAAKLNIQDYLNNGVFDGAGDLALQHAFFTATQPSAGFRMTKVQQDTLQSSRSWLGGVEAKALHAQTGEWYTPEQRQQIATAALSAIADKEKSLQPQIPPAPPSNGATAPKTAADYLKSVGVQ